METTRTLLFLGIWTGTWTPHAADFSSAPTAQDVHWVSLDFTTMLTWRLDSPGHDDFTYSVLFSMEDSDWTESPDCTQMFGTQCDLTDHLLPLDRSYQADIKTEPLDVDMDDDPETFPHTYSPHFNPYKQSNISAAKFVLQEVDETTVLVNISDPLTAIHQSGKQLSIRDVLKNDLKYKISYSKSGSTGKRDVISDSSAASVLGLDSGDNYCFMVAAFVPSRPRSSQQGAWSTQLCTDKYTPVLRDLSPGVWVGVVFVVLAVLVIVVTAIVLRRRGRRRGNKPVQQTEQTSV
ncbi:tissue factor-like [Cololabis saira]|uniref:tissue factor-like n=1 Tax=Cololabis saira TaxID=129043 RepID=UPI002AD466EF|nr:tissue factor-like [Cololabis saira]